MADSVCSKAVVKRSGPGGRLDVLEALGFAGLLESGIRRGVEVADYSKCSRLVAGLT